MKKNFTFLPLVILAVFATACSTHSIIDVSTGPIKTVALKASSIQKISTYSGIDVDYRQDSRTTVKVTAPEGALPYIKVNLENGNLECSIDSKGKSGINIRNARVIVTSPTLKEIKTGSGSTVNLLGKLNLGANDFEIETSSGSTVRVDSLICKTLITESSSGSTMNIKRCDAAEAKLNSSSASDQIIGLVASKNVYVQASSSSTIRLSGSAPTAKYRASSSADIHAETFKTKSCHASASSSADISCNSESVESQSSSSGKVKNKK